MFHQTEAKAQGWRAVAVFDDGSEGLIVLGRSSKQVRDGYAEAFYELYDEEQRAEIETINLQTWYGAPDAGHWQHKSKLRMPAPVMRQVILARAA